ncbi:hypothetical protein Hanom_Chr07g00665451 [Helianthus anomalus]
MLVGLSLSTANLGRMFTVFLRGSCLGLAMDWILIHIQSNLIHLNHLLDHKKYPLIH